jgi:hypothetical protein
LTPPINGTEPRKKGQALLFATLTLSFIFGLMALAIDLGWAYYKVEQAQGAADSAAMSAAVYALNNGHTCGNNGVTCGSVYYCANPNVNPATTNLQVGCLYAAANGFNNAGDQSVWLTADSSVPPGSRGSNVNYWVQANISENIPGLFHISQQQNTGGAALLLLGLTTSSSSAVSTAAITVTPSASCIYAIDTGNTANAFTVSGSATVTSSCGIYVNSSNTGAINLNGSASVHASQILVHGNYTINNRATVSPTPTTDADVQADPLANLPAPSVGVCDHINWNWSSSNSATLNPGVYCGGITITGSGPITFNPGTYIINGGGFNWGGSATLTGSHVMFYITGQNGYTAAPLNASGNGSINLTAPSSGAFEGLLFYQDRSLTYTTANTFNGNSNSVTTGAFYFPTTSLTYSGSSTGRYQALVAKTITMSGNANFLNDTTGTFTALSSKTASLIQ